MAKQLKNYIIRFSIIFLLLITAFSLFYIFLVQTILNTESNRLAYLHHLNTQELLNQRLTTLRTAYNEGELVFWDTLDYNVEDVKKPITKLYEIDKLSNVFHNQTSDEIVILFKHTAFNQVIYKEFSDVLLEIGIELGSNQVLIDDLGFIKYYENYDYYGVNYFSSSLIPETLSNTLDEKLSNEQTYYTNYQENQSYVLSFTTLSNGYKFISIQEQVIFLNYFQPILWSYFALSVTTLIGYVLFSILTIRRRIVEELLFEKMMLNKQNPYLILEVGGLGQIRRMNKKFKELIPETFEFKFITDLTSEPLDIKLHLKKELAFYMNIDKLSNEILRVRFLVSKGDRNYIMIGEIIDASSNDMSKYVDLARRYRLTNLPNQIALEERIVALDRRSKFSLISLTMDEFDQVKDSIGRGQTESLVKAAASFFQGLLDSNMELYHLELNHFVILVTNVANFEVLNGYAKGISDQLDKKMLISDLPQKIKLLIGILHNQGKATQLTLEEIFNVLYLTIERAKISSSTNIVQYNDRFLDFVTKTNQLELDIKQGILKDEFQMHLQPQVDIQTQNVVGFELLLRWNNEKYAKESPALYIKQAERSNLIIELGRVITEKVFKIVSEFKDLPIEFSFNISPKQLLQPGFINEFIELRDKYQVDPSKLAIELTETLLILQFDLIIEKFKALKQLGFKVQLDDFGTGYSSLSYLRDLPIDIIKIDKKFVDDIENSFQARQILKTMITLGRNLKLGVIIEGVENEKQTDIIKRDGGTYIQGFFISRAMPLEDAKKFIKNRVKEIDQ
ncbi:Bacteriophytochrome cph2 [Acholeplasma oculi]|uniref:Diguanylate cyclase/Phosphodiesterase n=1 Tax=Acholeplasma oculi TaxID=35623 RepID=A0A061AAX0_9MOLU|nr:GGDEF domain-containing phosphodiesterase [Acholeplasma oculi]CDR30544.1 Diguanylate cyclase/Phosphodiesterase [Acholeplasma oculi]SKC47280.1 EAL domain, c-di-GMP-specific phosphodiesterase class I (or its enzymatically inactive variant) [Acholeplasma oculi]SUT89216.1 Bacteriophytochrome cph2 [Acholeplasma oculi]